MSLPVGSIIAWHKNLTGTPALPAGWVECNGGTLDNVDSPYHGLSIPNLNGDKRFLRGGSVSGDLQTDAMQGHRHDSYIDTGTAVNGSQGIGGHGSPGETLFTGDGVRDPKTDGTNGTPRIASETRPINMSVVWIMKVSDTQRESRLIPEEVEDVHVNVNTTTPKFGGSGGKIGVMGSPPSAGGGAGGMVPGVLFEGKIPLGRWRVGKVEFGGCPGQIVESDELKFRFSYPFMSSKLGKPFNYSTCVFYQWDEVNHLWITLDSEKFGVASYFGGGVASPSQYGAEVWVKNAEPGEYILFGALQPD